jgi:hypothetical protein
MEQIGQNVIDIIKQRKNCPGSDDNWCQNNQSLKEIIDQFGRPEWLHRLVFESNIHLKKSKKWGKNSYLSRK